jgi:hypothetical protein
MSMKVENGLIDGRNIENWLQSTEKGLQNVQKRHVKHNSPLQVAGIWALDVSPLISALWDSWSNSLPIYR